MTDRERLIELIVNADTYDSYECKLCTKEDTSCTHCNAGKLADHILADGWIRPPCKVGDILWIPSVISNKVYSKVIKEILIHEKDGEIGKYVYASSAYFPFDDIGKTVFLTKEEAEEKFKELKKQ